MFSGPEHGLDKNHKSVLAKIGVERTADVLEASINAMLEMFADLAKAAYNFQRFSDSGKVGIC